MSRALRQISRFKIDLYLNFISIFKILGDMDDRSDQGQMDRDGLMEGPVAMVEEAARKREVRLLKNREAARECRRKKKEYIKDSSK